MKAKIGVCSWSLQVTTPVELAERVQAIGARGVQIALDPLRTGAWRNAELRDALAGVGAELISGMMGMEGEDYSTLESIRTTGGVRPDATWSTNVDAARGNARVARELGLDLVTFHAGFLPHESTDPERDVLLDRLRTLVDVFAAEGVRVGFETGQERAETLLGVLDELGRDTAGVNFDPANMILYGMGDPIEALRALLPHVLQVHVKDAIASKTPGSWGEEVPVGRGEVAWNDFFDVLAGAGRPIDMLIEREAGTDRVGDIRLAHELVTRQVERTA